MLQIKFISDFYMIMIRLNIDNYRKCTTDTSIDHFFHIFYVLILF